MAEVLIFDWIQEFESLTESETQTYCEEQENNHEVIVALHVIFDNLINEKNNNVLERVCQQLFGFYRSGEISLKRFTMQYIPTLVLLHLSNKKAYPAIETLILSIYNLEVVDSKLKPRTKSFRVPSIAQSSLYHDASTLDPAFTGENALRRFETCNTKLVNWGPFPQVETFNAQNRQRIITALVFLFNQQIVNVSVAGLEHTCKAISRYINQGFHVGGSARTSMDSDNMAPASLMPRIVVSNQLLLELLHVVYFSIEKGVSGASQTLHDITQRAMYEAYSDVLLVTNSISNLLHRVPSTLMPSKAVKQPLTKSMITNASFRTKKLPDDIPIQHTEEGAGDASLDSIVEEGGGDLTDKKGYRGRSGSALKHLPKLPGMGKKPKQKNSPTPPRHSLEESVIDSRSNINMQGGGEPVSLVISNSNGSMQSEVNLNTVHVSTV